MRGEGPGNGAGKEASGYETQRLGRRIERFAGSARHAELANRASACAASAMPPAWTRKSRRKAGRASCKRERRRARLAGTWTRQEPRCSLNVRLQAMAKAMISAGANAAAPAAATSETRERLPFGRIIARTAEAAREICRQPAGCKAAACGCKLRALQADAWESGCALFARNAAKKGRDFRQGNAGKPAAIAPAIAAGILAVCQARFPPLSRLISCQNRDAFSGALLPRESRELACIPRLASR